MPDRDVFTHRVPKGWKTNARLLFNSEVVPEIAIERVSRRSVSELRRSGSTAIREMIALFEALQSQDKESIHASDISIISQLRRIATNDDSRWGEIAARRLGSAATLARYEPGMEPTDLRMIIVDVLADYIEQRIVSGGLIAALVAEENHSQESVDRRIDEIRTLLASSDVLRSAASQLLGGAEARKIKLPERTLQNRSTAELVRAAF